MEGKGSLGHRGLVRDLAIQDWSPILEEALDSEAIVLHHSKAIYLILNHLARVQTLIRNYLKHLHHSLLALLEHQAVESLLLRLSQRILLRVGVHNMLVHLHERELDKTVLKPASCLLHQAEALVLAESLRVNGGSTL
jgi:hypothetical protein